MKLLKLLTALLVVGVPGTQAQSGGEQIHLANSTFDNVPVECQAGYAYQSPAVGVCTGSAVPFQAFNGTAGIGWTFVLSGLTRPNTAFYPPSFFGMPFRQAAFLQGAVGAISQRIFGLAAGTPYELNVYLGSRFASNSTYDGNQTVVAMIDDQVIATWQLVSFTPFTLRTVPFGVSVSGPHKLTFAGAAPGDHTAFFSGVSIEPVGAAGEE